MNDEHEAIAPYTTAAEIAEGRRRSERYAAQSKNNDLAVPPPSGVLGDRKVLILNTGGAEETQRVVEAVSRTMATEIFSADGRLYLLRDDGQLVAMSNHSLRELIAARFASVRLVRREGRFEREYAPVEISSQGVTDIMAALVLRVAKAPAIAPRALSSQLRDEIVIRIRQGEARAALAKAYDTDLATIQQIEAAAPPRW
jgi:hypothetical protein